MIHLPPRRTRAFRQLVTPKGYRAPGYRPTSKAIPAIMNGELKEMQSRQKERGS